MDHFAGLSASTRKQGGDPWRDSAPPVEETLDPEDWHALRAMEHPMLDDMPFSGRRISWQGLRR